MLWKTCHGSFLHHQQQLALIGTLGTRRMVRSVTEKTGRTNYPSASAWSCSAPATPAGSRGWSEEELILQCYQIGEPRQGKTQLLSYDQGTARGRPPRPHCITSPLHHALAVTLSIPSKQVLHQHSVLLHCTMHTAHTHDQAKQAAHWL